MSRAGSSPWLAVAAAFLALCLTAPPAAAHPEPFEQEELLQLAVALESFWALDSYDSFLRGPTGEFLLTVHYLYEDGHEAASGTLSKRVEGVSGGVTYCLQPPKQQSRAASETCIPEVIFTHDHCHPLRDILIKLDIWEDDGDSETMAAFRWLLKEAAKVASSATDEIAQSLADQILEISGLNEVLNDWLDSLSEEIRNQLGDDVGAIVNLAVGIALDRALERGYAAADEELVQLSEPVRDEVDRLARELNLTEEAKQRLLQGSHSLLDSVLDGLIDVLIGAGNDEVGSYEGPLLPNWQPEARRAGYSGSLHTHNFDTSKNTGAVLDFSVAASHSGGRFGEVASDTTACPRPAKATDTVTVPTLDPVPSGSRLTYPGQVIRGTYTFGSVVDAEGRPVEGAVVAVGDTSTTTDSEGHFYYRPGGSRVGSTDSLHRAQEHAHGQLVEEVGLDVDPSIAIDSEGRVPVVSDPASLPVSAFDDMDSDEFPVFLVNRVEGAKGSDPPPDTFTDTEVVPADEAGSSRLPVLEEWPRYMWWEDLEIHGRGLDCHPAHRPRAFYGDQPARILTCDGGGTWTVQALTADGTVLPPGPVDFTVSLDGYQSDPVTIQNIALNLALDPPTIHVGKSGHAVLGVEGSTDHIPLSVTNVSPGVVTLTEGDQQIVWTSGGESNQVKVKYKGVSPGRFQLDIRIVEDQIEP